MSNKQIPLLFEEAAIYQPLTPLSEALPNTGKTRVRLFYKYRNRNGSYITDKVAEQIIKSAPAKPVVGFFDREIGDYTTHLGEKIVSAYGFVSETPNFAWEKHLDKDGKEREYACFDVILHTEYFPEANKIVGQPQSMELASESITGDWGEIEDEICFIYTSATLKGLCVLGKNVEPCFEGSAFFSYENSQFDKFSALLLDLQAKVKEAENLDKGGDSMDKEEFEQMEEQVVEEQVVEAADEKEIFSAEEPVMEDKQENFEENPIEETAEIEVTENEAETFEEVQESTASTEETFEVVEVEAETEPEVAMVPQAQYESLQNDFNSVKEQKEALEFQLSEVQKDLEAAQAAIANYQKLEKQLENERKESLISNYEKMLSAEEIEEVRGSVEDFSYEELDSKMAKMFAHKNINQEQTFAKKIPVVEEESDFAVFMKKYKK